MEGDNKDAMRQKCEVYSRVVGYIRPVDQWNAGKQSEFSDRSTFETKACSSCSGEEFTY